MCSEGKIRKMLNNYLKLKRFLQTDSIPKECMLYSWLKHGASLVDLLERKLESLERILLDDETKKAGSLRGEILSSGSHRHKCFEALSEIELAGSLVEAGLTPKFDVKLPDGKDFDIEVPISNRPVFFEIKTAQRLRSKGERLKDELLGYKGYLMQNLVNKEIMSVNIDITFSTCYFEKEIITRKEIDQLLKLIDEDILSTKDLDGELIYHFQQSAGKFKRGDDYHSIRLQLDPSVQKGKPPIRFGEFIRFTPGEEEIQHALNKIMEKLQNLDRDQVLKYQPLIGYFNMVARTHASRFYEDEPEEITKNILPKLYQFKEFSAFILTYWIGSEEQGDVFKRKLVCNQSPLVHLTDEEKSFITSLEGFIP